MIRKAHETDILEIIQFVRAYHAFEGVEISERQREAAVRSLISDKSLGGIWLVYDEEVPVGYIALCFGFSIEFAGRDVTIDEFYILPEFRGKGLGSQALEQIKETARNLNVKAIHLEVARTNTRGMRLYSQANFVERDKYLMMTAVL